MTNINITVCSDGLAQDSNDFCNSSELLQSYTDIILTTMNTDLVDLKKTHGVIKNRLIHENILLNSSLILKKKQHLINIIFLGKKSTWIIRRSLTYEKTLLSFFAIEFPESKFLHQFYITGIAYEWYLSCKFRQMHINFFRQILISI